MTLTSRDGRNIANQLYFNKKEKKRKGLMRKEHSAPLQALIWLPESKGQAEAGFLP